MGGGAGRTLKQVAHACNTRQSVSYHIRSWEEKSRILPDFICKNNWFSACFYNFEHGIMAHIRQLWMHAYLMMLAWPISGTMKMGC